MVKKKQNKKKPECSFPTKKSKRSSNKIKTIKKLKSLKCIFEIVATDIRDLDFINVFSCV